QFLRFAKAAKERGGKVIVECQPALLKLLANTALIDQLVGRGRTLPPFDLQAPLLSLPGILGVKASTIPADVPYLHADHALIRHWKSERAGSVSDGSLSTTSVGEASDSRFHVGIAWQGSPTYHNDCQRSIPLKYFLRLLDVPGVQLISLQKGPG